MPNIRGRQGRREEKRGEGRENNLVRTNKPKHKQTLEKKIESSKKAECLWSVFAQF